MSTIMKRSSVFNEYEKEGLALKQYDVVIIGGGPAGYSAALYSARGMLSTLVVNRGADGGQMVNTRQIDNYPGAGVGMDGWDLGEKMKDQAVQFGAEIKNGTVASVELTGQLKTVTLSDGAEITARAVILAMGAYPRPLGVKGEAEFRGKGVSYCATCDGMFFRKKTVAVVGGGDTAIEDALLLAKTCEKVYLIHRRDTFRAAPVEVELAKNTENIELVLCDTVEEICGEQKVTEVKLRSGRTLAVDGVFVAVGTIPDTELVKEQVTLNAQGYVVADETTKTNLPGVYVAGDLRVKPLRQVITAASDGAVAATQAVRELLGI